VHLLSSVTSVPVWLIHPFFPKIDPPMNDLPMPSDVKREAVASDLSAQPRIEPPSATLIVRLFLIPFLIVAAAVGVMFLVSLMAGRAPTVGEAIDGLKSAGGGRTADYLVGPGAKQRYLYAKALTDHMKSGLAEPERVKLTGALIDILDNHTQPGEGEVLPFLLLALGRCWQLDPAKSPASSNEALAAQQKAAAALLKYAESKDVSTRKAAVLAMVYFRGRDVEVKKLLPLLAKVVRDEKEDLDVRLAAATILGPLATPGEAEVLDALHAAMRDTDPHDVELVWAAALSLAQLDHPDVADTILKLLSRQELASVKVYDREKDPQNPVFRNLSEGEQERILINTMIGVERYKVPAVQARLKELSETDPSQRVRAALKSNAPRDAVSEIKR
jgi:hypothetical protein